MSKIPRGNVSSLQRGNDKRGGKGDSGVYCLLIRLGRAAGIRVGKFGKFHFPAGYYAYVGSAQRGLRARIRRHCGRRKRLRWHVDYLLERAQVVEVFVRRGAPREYECRLASVIGRCAGARALAPRFGASDCRCPGHLWFLMTRPSRTAAVRRKGLDKA